MLRTTPTYTPLAQADVDVPDNDVPATDEATQAWSGRDTQPYHRPPVYYGDGPFDAPSSEDEDDDEKNTPRRESAGMRVLHGLGYRDDAPEDGLEDPIASGLVVGQKVRSVSSL